MQLPKTILPSLWYKAFQRLKTTLVRSYKLCTIISEHACVKFRLTILTRWHYPGQIDLLRLLERCCCAAGNLNALQIAHLAHLVYLSDPGTPGLWSLSKSSVFLTKSRPLSPVSFNSRWDLIDIVHGVYYILWFYRFVTALTTPFHPTWSTQARAQIIQVKPVNECC